MPMVTASAADATTPPTLLPAEDLIASTAWCTAFPTHGGIPISARRASSADSPAASANQLDGPGQEGKRQQQQDAADDGIAAAHTMPAAALLERPRARNRSTKGAKTAEITTATRIDAVTVHRVVHTYRTTATSPAIAMTRQPRAARFTSQSGTSWGRRRPRRGQGPTRRTLGSRAARITRVAVRHSIDHRLLLTPHAAIRRRTRSGSAWSPERSGPGT